MDELVRELAVQPRLKGAALMKVIRGRMPEAQIEVVLDVARLADVHQNAEDARLHTFDSVADLIAHISTLGMSDEDFMLLARILNENKEGWIPEEIAQELGSMLVNEQLLRSFRNLFLKLSECVEEEPPRGCFTWAGRLLGKLRRPKCSSCFRPTSPDTGK